MNEMQIEKLCKIRQLYREIEQYEADFESRFKICFNQGVMLCLLSRHKTLTSGELAENLNLTLSNTSKIIAQVEKKGLIERVPCENDKRVTQCSLTNKGHIKIKQLEGYDLRIPEVLKNFVK